MADPRYGNFESDPYAVNPFAEGEPQDITSGVPSIEDSLPFRFTQFAINPTTTATSGQTGRMAVARSPFTSGALAKELTGIKSQLSKMGNVQNPEQPTAPDVQSYLSAMPEPAVTSTQEMRQAQPVEGQSGGISTDPLGSIPLTDKTFPWKTEGKGYDLQSIIEPGVYSAAMSAKSPTPEQWLIRNLSMVPSSVKMDLNNPNTLQKLTSKNFAMGPMGTGQVTTLGRGGQADADIEKVDSYSPVTDQWIQDWLAREPDQKNWLEKNMGGLVSAGAMGVIGLASGGTLGPMLAPYIGMGAGGVGGAMGLTGAGATLANTAAGAVGALGLNAGLSAAGVDMSNPLAQMAGAVAGGAVAGGMNRGGPAMYPGAQNAPVLGEGPLGGMTDLTNPQSIAASATQRATELGISTEELARSMGFDSFDTLIQSASTSPSGIPNTMSQSGDPNMNKYLLDRGQDVMNTFGQPEMPDMNMPPGYTEYGDSGMMLNEQGYMDDLNAYNTNYAAYQEQLAELEKFQQLQADYDAKLDQYYQQQSQYGTAQDLKSKQSGLYSSISDMISENPAYQRPMNLTGIQSQFV